MFCRRLLTTAVLAVVGVLTAPAVSQAAFTITVAVQGGGSHTFFAPSPYETILGSVTLNGLEITVIGKNNNTNSSDGGLLSTASIDVKSAGGTLSPKVLTITSSADGFTTNPNPLTVNTTLAASLLGGSATGTSSINGAVLAGSGVSIVGATTDNSTVHASPGTPFTLGNEMVIHLAGSTARAGTPLASLTVTSALVPAPAPAGLMLIAGAVPFIGLLRRVLKRPITASEAVVA